VDQVSMLVLERLSVKTVVLRANMHYIEYKTIHRLCDLSLPKALCFEW